MGLSKLFDLFKLHVAFSHIDREDLVGLQEAEVYYKGLFTPGTTFAHRYILLRLAKNSDVSYSLLLR